ncbi:CHAT domain-containing protein [Aquimarina spongiae]|uniref:CHAT domain-containing protein n=2 Tax=Aquimarina spongiae TaxID=570521 RepID=A0A1M6EG99_9FLAO|nr:CHAT domain-containing protein [Aquimarina spongiae]
MFLRRYYLLLAFVIIYFNSDAQNSTNWESILASEFTVEQKRFKIDSIIKFYKTTQNDSTLERITHKYAIWHYKNTTLSHAIKMAEKSLDLKQKIDPTNTSLIQHGLKNLGFFNYKYGNFSKSISYYNQLISLNSNNNYAADAYSELGRCYTNLYDYHNAVIHFELANSLYRQKKNYKGIITNAINSGRLDVKIGTVESLKRGITNLLAADSISSKINTKKTTKYNTKFILGTLYNHDNNLNTKKAFFYYDQALSIARTLKNPTLIAKTYEIMGNLYNTIDQDLAISYHQRAIENLEKKDSISLAISISNIGICKVWQQKFNEGINNYKKAIALLSGQTLSEEETSKKNNLLTKGSNSQFLLPILEDLADAYLKHYQSTNTLLSLQESIDTFLKADQLIDIIRIESQEFQSKLYWRKHSANLYGRAIEACFLANDIENGFYFSEKNKALILSEDITKNRVKQSLSLPEHIINKEIKFKKEIYLLNNLTKNNSDQKERNVTTIRLLDLKRQLKELQDSIKNVFSNYAKFDIQDSPTPSIELIQKNLDKKTVFLEYNISNHTDFGIITKTNNYLPIYEGSEYGKKEYSKGYLFCITKHESYFIQLPDTDQLKFHVSAFIQKVSNPFKVQEDVKSYIELGYNVFDYLFPSKDLKKIIENRRLIVVPDNYLSFIPFEALVTSKELGKRPKYLIESSEISYSYSNFFLSPPSITSSQNKTVSLLGFAPVNFKKQGLISLENSATEIMNTNTIFPGKVFLNKDASKENFLNNLADKSIIHLATHADGTNAVSPWIAFSDRKLTLEELYFTENHADLVVLSGCNTSLGRQETGEGVMSLARGFFHSGAKSVVSSLWNVDDRSTTYIMNEFYKNLKKRLLKSQALRKAKLSYLSTSSLSESSPHFWATFVLLGDTSPIQDISFIDKYWLIIALVLLIILILIQQFRRKIR